MQIKNRHNIDDIFLRLHERYSKEREESVLSREIADPWDVNVSVTELLNPLQISLLMRYFEKQTSKDLNNLLPSLIGSAVHEALARTDDDINSLKEVRLFKIIDGMTVSGQPDRMFQETKKIRTFKNNGDVWVKGQWAIQDYKLTGAYSTLKNKREWEEQLNCYAYMAQRGLTASGNSLEQIDKIDNLFVTAIVRDWNYNNVGKPDYPESWVVDIQIPVWSEEEQRDFLHNKVNAFQEAIEKYKETKELPRCTDEERWSSGGKFAVMKPKRKSAVKLFGTEEEAKEFSITIPDAYIESRPVRYMRCDRYCDVSKVCQQVLE